MSYKDDQQEKDLTPKGDRDYTEEEIQRVKEAKEQASKATYEKSKSPGRKSLFSRFRDSMSDMFSGIKNRGKKGVTEFKAEQEENGAVGGFAGVLKSFATPKKLAILATAGGVGAFSLFGIFSTYKNDGIIRNDTAINCQTGYIDLKNPGQIVHRVKQETVNTFYDIFCRTMGYSEEFLAGMLGCMNAECGLHYSGIEIDWNTEDDDPEGNRNKRYALFYSYAGGGDINDDVYDINPTTQDVLNAYYSYSDSIGPTWINQDDKAVGVYTCDNGHFGAGIGLIGWTGNAGVDFITGVDKIYQDYDWYDLPYQCAYILATFKQDGTDSMMRNGEWRTEMQSKLSDIFEYTGNVDENGERLYKYTGRVYTDPSGYQTRQSDTVDMDKIPESLIEDFAAAKWFFESYVNGGESDTQKYACILDRWSGIEEIKGMIEKAKVDGRYSADVTSMADLLYMNTINDEVYDAQNTQICVNGSVIDNIDIATAALSISWLSKADYMDDEAAYGEYRRSPQAPVLINDWDFIEASDTAPGLSTDKKADHKIGEYESGSLAGLDHYATADCGEGNHDLIACTEFYYYAHLIAFPTEINSGCFSSCDRGTGTAVRISGADDNFPAGGPYQQLAYVLGASGSTDRSDQLNGQNQELWKATGFLRGCDWYSFEGRNGIGEGNIAMSWNSILANGYTSKQWDVESRDVDPMSEANLRFVFTQDRTQGHIITYTGGSAVRSYWGTKYLLQQYNGFDDTDSLVRGDLTIQAPKVMQDGANFKAIYAKDAFDQNITFYVAQQEHANDSDSNKISDGGSFETSLMTHRLTQYNQKTGLPEFHSWEQIFIRLTHDSDDNLRSISYNTNKDGYYDDHADHIVQYSGSNSTSTSMFFTNDWDGVGVSGAEPHEDLAEYHDDGKDWYDSGSDKWTNMFTNDNVNPYWRYEIVADSEYRTNQLERFSMASLMCSYAGENDTGVVQNTANHEDAEDASGHILGNVYRRMSRIGENSDISGRYYYYNTVVSNDMFQDLVQLYNVEGPSAQSNRQIDNGYNYGPYYDLEHTGAGMAIPNAKSRVNNYGDRRYGLTMTDINNIFAGFARDDADVAEKAGWGTDSDDQNNIWGYSENSEGTLSDRLYKYLTTPLYDIKKEINGYGTGNISGNEGNHMPTDQKDVYYDIGDDDEIYAGELYGINPYLMVKEYKNGEMGSLNADIKSDFMMTFIDRHYYADDYGNINTYAYANLAMYPSIGKMTDASSYMAALNDLKTINSNGSEKMISCLGKLKYTDYIYGETVTDNQAMAKRLYGNDDRDGNNLRDDYNRRDWIVIPYYHTHAQNCEHEEFLSEYTPYDVVAGCKWSTEAEYNIDCHKIDTIYWLNNTCKDALNTFTLDLKNIDVRGKYDVSALEYLSACKGTSADIRYFTEDGEKIKITDHPDIHVTCDGYTSYGPGTCDICGEALLTEDDSCSHSCEECVELKPNFDHGHTECDNGEDGHPDDCHEKYGCSKLEYLYHEKNIAIYMAIPVCDDPEEFDINDFKSGGKIVPDKANLLQLIEYDNKGFVKTDYKSTINAMQDPLKVNLGRDGLEARGAAPYSYMKYTYNPGYKKNLVGYFTIEGNVITRKFDKRGEEVNDSDVDVCQAEDLQLIESVRNRVGLGKDGRTDGNTYISQKETPITNFEEIPYSSDTGDYLVTGRSHDKSPAVNDSSYYDNGMSGFSTGADLCGNYANDPDTAKNNSLIRFLCGDEHVYHIRFGSQDEDVIKNSDEFNDIRIFDEFVDYDDDAMYIDCETGELTTQPYSAMAEQYKDKNTGEYSSKADKYKNMPLKNTDKGGWKPSSNKGSDNGDYGLWITHASRGDRGMKTEYIVVKEWFGDPYDNDLSDANMQYMFFEPVMQKDKNDVDGDGDTEEPYIYGKNVNGAVRTDVYYGQGTNSRWRQLIDAYVESLKTPQ